MLIDWPQLESTFKSDWGTGFLIKSAEPVAGGDSHLAFDLDTNQGRYFLKLNTPDSYDVFDAEQNGLFELRKCGAWVVPEPLVWGKTANVAYLCMEYLNLSNEPIADEQGLALARLHQTIGQDGFGWHRNNFLGPSVQHNNWSNNWPEFFWSQRLAPQLMTLLDANSDFPDAMLSPLEIRVKAILDDTDALPSLVHGDFWQGNVGVTDQGEPALFDPALYWGHSETDLAMAKLFGGFSPVFFEAYHSLLPVTEGGEQRLLIYQLYHLLNHHNLFGGDYLDKAIKHIGQILR